MGKTDNNTLCRKQRTSKIGVISIILIVIVGCSKSDSKSLQWELKDAIEAGDIDKVKSLLSKKPGLVNTKDKRGGTPLHLAAHKGHKEIVEFLISKGAEVNAGDTQGATPLHYEAMDGHKEMVELLVTKGADVNAKDKKGRTPLSIAIGNGHNEVAELLRKYGSVEQ